jgi:ubiquinone/menaquinone biosynthesis C-methylase UbiE
MLFKPMEKGYYQRNSEITACLKQVFKFVAEGNLGNIVEIAPGYGYGAYATALGLSFGHYFMVDIADTRLAIIKSSGFERFDKLVFIKQTAAMMPFRENSIDIVVAVNSLWYCWDSSEYFRCIKEGIRVLKHNGTFIMYESAVYEKADELQGFFLSNKCSLQKHGEDFKMCGDSRLMLMTK